MLETESAIQLLCGHREHTRCFLANLITHQTAHIVTCSVCQEFVIPNDLTLDEEDQEENDTQEAPVNVEQKLRDTYWENETFRREVKEYVASLKLLGKAKVALQKAIQSKKTAIHTEMAGIKQQIQDLIGPQIAALKTSAEYKEYNRLKSKIKRKITTLARIEPDADHYTLRNSLMRQRGLRVWPIYSGWRYHRSSQRAVSRAFYYKIRI